MAQSPIAVLIIIVGTLVFQALLFGNELAERSFPTLTQNEHSAEDCKGFLGDFGCGMKNALTFVTNFFKVIWGVISFFFGLVTFNVPGAPWFIRLTIGTIISGAIIWSLTTLLRGN